LVREIFFRPPKLGAKSPPMGIELHVATRERCLVAH